MRQTIVSNIKNLSDFEFQNIINKSSSISDIVTNFGCSSQQITSNGKNRIKKLKHCYCGKVIKYKGYFCTSCSKIKKFEVSKEELEQLIKEKPMTEIGKIFGVSDNAIKKRCKKLGIELKPMRGQWSKIKSSATRQN